MYGMNLIPLDIDVAVLEDIASHKEGVAMSYHQVKGYAPIFCYAGKQGYMVANEMRPGSQHSEKCAVEFLERCVAVMLAAGYRADELLLRVDSGHDAADFIRKAQELASTSSSSTTSSGSMATNALMLGLASIAFNCLRLIGSAVLPTPVKDSDPKRLRLRTVLLWFIKIGSKLVRHAKRLLLKINRHFPYLNAIRKVEAIC